MNYLVLTAATEAAKFDYMRDIGLPFGRLLLYVLIGSAVLILITVFTRPELWKREKPTAAQKAAAAAGFIAVMKVIALIVFLPFYIIAAGIKKK